MPRKKGIDIDQEYAVVPIGSVQEHPQNPRLGVEEAIDESIDTVGWYGACIVQRSTGNILAGNHRYRVAKKRGAKEVPVIYRDVDDETALRIVLGDNKIADLGGYDEELLDTLLSSLETLDGTGYGLAAVEAAEESPEAEEGAEEGLPGPDDVPDDAYTPEYGVMVVCTDADHQAAVYEQLQALDLTLRVVAV